MRLYGAVALTAVAVALLARLGTCVVISNDDLVKPPQSFPYNSNLHDVEELPFDYNDGPFTTVKKAPGCSPEQVRLSLSPDLSVSRLLMAVIEAADVCCTA